MEIGTFDSTRRLVFSLFLVSLQESRLFHYPILDEVIQLQLTCTKVACLRFELVDTGNQQSNKEVDWQKSIICILKTFDFFPKVFKYKIVFCISNTYFKYMYFKYCPSLGTSDILTSLHIVFCMHARNGYKQWTHY